MQNNHALALLEFFDFERFYEGEYPFYTSDYDLVNSNRIRKKAYRNGKRTSITLPPVSTETPKGQRLLNEKIIADGKCEQLKQLHDPFLTFALHRWETLVTKSQKEFLLDCLEGNQKNYSKQQRWQFRSQIQKRLKMGFIGIGGGDVSIYKIGEFKIRINQINKFLEVDEDNVAYSLELKKSIDKEYVNSIVYERLTSEARINIIQYVQNKIDTIESVHLYEFHNYLIEDMEQFEVMGLA